MVQPVTGATFISLGTAEKQPHQLNVHVATIVSDFTSPRLTFLRLKDSCLMNLSVTTLLKIMCVRVNSTPSIRNVSQGFPRVSEQMTNVKPGYRKKKHPKLLYT